MVIYRSYYEAGRFLSDKERLDYYDRILNYGIEGVEKKKCEKVEMLFSLIKPNIDSNNIKYHNGSKGGRPSTKKPVVLEKNNQRFGKTESNVDVDEDVNDDVDVNDNEEEEIKKTSPPEDKSKKYGDYVKMLPEEYQKLIDRFGEKIIKSYIYKLDLYVGSRGKTQTYKSYYRAVLSWLDKDGIKEKKIENKKPKEEEKEMTPEEKAESKRKLLEMKQKVFGN